MDTTRDHQPNRIETQNDPPDFAAACALLYTINLGDRAFPVDIAALDAWAERHGTPEARGAYRRKRAAVVTAFVAKDIRGTGEALEDLHQFVHLLRALPMAHSGARAGRSQSLKASAPRKVTDENRERIRRHYADRVAAGERYGAIKALSRQYKVSERTIRNIVKEP